jgi:hypothetical protein
MVCCSIMGPSEPRYYAAHRQAPRLDMMSVLVYSWFE